MVVARRAEMPSMAEGAPEAVFVFPRKKVCDTPSSSVSAADDDSQRTRVSRKRRPSEFTYACVERFFDRPLTEAAEAFGVSVTTMKQICRKFGVSRWPYKRQRRVSSSSSCSKPATAPSESAEPTTLASHVAPTWTSHDHIVVEVGIHRNSEGTWSTPADEIGTGLLAQESMFRPIPLVECTGGAWSSSGSCASIRSISTEPCTRSDIDDSDTILDHRDGTPPQDLGRPSLCSPPSPLLTFTSQSSPFDTEIERESLQQMERPLPAFGCKQLSHTFDTTWDGFRKRSAEPMRMSAESRQLPLVSQAASGLTTVERARAYAAMVRSCSFRQTDAGYLHGSWHVQ